MTLNRRIVDGQWGVWAVAKDDHDADLLYTTNGGRTWQHLGWLDLVGAGAWLDLLESRLAHYAAPLARIE